MNENINTMEAKETKEVQSEITEKRFPKGKFPKLPTGKQGMLIKLVGGGILIVLILCLLMGGRKTVNMADYVGLNFSGLDGQGRAQMVVNYKGMADLVELKGDAKDLYEQLGGVVGDTVAEWAKYEVLSDAIFCKLEQDDGLSNGDHVKVTVEWDDTLCKQIGIRVKGKELTFTVEGLMEVTNFDAFQDIEVIFSGTSPNGTAQVMNNSRDDACLSYDYYLDKSSGLSNGDVVTVTISDGDVEYVAEETGKAPLKMSQVYTVSGLESYVTELSQITDTALKEVQREALDGLNAYVAKQWANPENFNGAEYQGCYFLSKKPHANSYTENRLYLVYLVTWADASSGESVSYYYYASYSNLKVDPDGQISVDLSSRSTPPDRYSFSAADRSYYVYGYETLDKLFKTQITSNLDNYTYESSMKEVEAAP